MTCCEIGLILSDNKFKNTKDRHTILELFKQPRTWSASQLSQKIKRPNLSTIYRNLNAFEKAGLIKSVYERNTETYFETSSKKHHAHKICPKCGIGECTPCNFVGSKEHLLQIFDLCSRCI